MNSPIVSIIVPIYNVEKYLRRCLDTVISQSYSNWELICVNDASPDGCAAILAEYEAKDSRIRTIIHAENKGLSGARNSGLAQAQGKWVLFVDSDDYIHPQLLEQTLNFAKIYDADLVSFDYERTDTDFCIPTDGYEKITDFRHKLTEAPLYHRKKRGNWVIHGAAWTHLYKRELIQRLLFAPILFEDYPFTLQVLLRRPRTVIMRAKLYYYTTRDGSIMNCDLTSGHLLDYQRGLEVVWDACRDATPAERKHVLQELFPDIIKQMFNRIRRSSAEAQPELWRTFASVLRHLDGLGCLKFRGHKISRWLRYKKLMRTY